MEAANEREEALAVCAVLRGAVEHAGEIAALVTPDRGLARRVAVELLRWGIEVDDSGGRPLGITPAGVLARLVAEVALRGAAAEPLLALLKHPLAAFGLERAAARHAARALERAVLRGPRLKPGLRPLRDTLERLDEERGKSESGAKRFPSSEASRTLSATDWRAALDLVRRLSAALGPLEALADHARALPLPEIVAAHRAAIAEVARDESGTPNSAFAGEAGEALARAFEEFSASAAAGPALQPQRLSRPVRRPYRAHQWCGGAAASIRASTSGARWRRGCRASTRSCSAA